MASAADLVPGRMPGEPLGPLVACLIGAAQRPREGSPASWSGRAAWPPVPRAGSAAWQEMDRATLDAIEFQARALLGAPWPRLVLSDYARYWRDGNRTEFEDRLTGVRHRVALATIAAAHTSDEALVDEVADGVMLLAEMTSWCWPAHERFAAEAGEVCPDPKRPYLDLGAAEVLATLAWVVYVLGDVLDVRAPGVTRRVRREADQRVFAPFELSDEWHWLGREERAHNWSAWIASNIVVGALFLIEDAGRRSRVLERAMVVLDRFLLALPSDGGIDEGYSYWWQGVGRALEALEHLAGASDGALDASAFTPLIEAARFPRRMAWSREWFVNVGDGSARPQPSQPWHVLHRWARRTGDGPLAAFAAGHRRQGEPIVDVSAGLGRALMGLADAGWRDAAGGLGAGSLPAWSWLPVSQVAVARPGGSHGLGFALKGGHNDEHHNHCDVGAVTIALDGVPYVVDAGQPTYTAHTFGPDRYGIWVMQSAWHSVPSPWGRAQGVGRAWRASGMEFVADGVAPAVLDGPAGSEVEGGGDRGGGCRASVELAQAYGIAGLESWRREVEFDEVGDRVTVTDSARACAAPASCAEVDGAGVATEQATGTTDTLPAMVTTDPLMTVRYLLAGEVGLVRPGRVAIAGPTGGRVMWLDFDAETVTAEFERRELDDPLLTRVWGSWLTRLTLRGLPSATSLRVEVRHAE